MSSVPKCFHHITQLIKCFCSAGTGIVKPLKRGTDGHSANVQDAEECSATLIGLNYDTIRSGISIRTTFETLTVSIIENVIRLSQNGKS